MSATQLPSIMDDTRTGTLQDQAEHDVRPIGQRRGSGLSRGGARLDD